MLTLDVEITLSLPTFSVPNSESTVVERNSEITFRPCSF